ncbi:MAG TPA: hypothetical protein VM717_03355 [Chthoniobacterales bacterium]|nr:hypothetical protein [Chthoniobacterales bacterium]
MTGPCHNSGMVLLNTIFIYMLAGLVFPDSFGEEAVDFKDNFYAHRRWFFPSVLGRSSSVC